jgi:hypothetical protein
MGGDATGEMDGPSPLVCSALLHTMALEPPAESLIAAFGCV